MEAQILENIQGQEHEEIVSKKQFSLLSVIYLVAGVALFIVYNQLTAPSQSSIRLIVMLLMILAFVVGIVKLLTGKKQLVLKADGTPVKEQLVFFDPRDSMRLQTLLDQSKYAEIGRLKHFKDDNSGVKMAALFSEDGKYVAYQLSEYKPFSYGAIGEIKSYHGDEAMPFVQCVKDLSAQN